MRVVYPGAVHVELDINGCDTSWKRRQHAGPLGGLREDLGLLGTKISCAEAACGACAVLLDPRAVASHVAGGFGRGPFSGVTLLRTAFIEEDALRYGYCTSGPIVSATAPLSASPQPTREEICDAMSGNLCRCGGYSKVERAIPRASGCS